MGSRATLILLTAAVVTLGPRGSAQADPPWAWCIVNAAEESGTFHHSFSASETDDVVFAVLLRAGPREPRLLTLRLFTPRGHLYQTMTVPLAGVGRAPGERKLPGFRRLLRERPVLPTVVGGSKFFRVDVRFPLGGTTIVSSSLYGRWRVEAYLDRDRKSCAPAQSFVITP